MSDRLERSERWAMLIMMWGGALLIAGITLAALLGMLGALYFMVYPSPSPATPEAPTCGVCVCEPRR